MLKDIFKDSIMTRLSCKTTLRAIFAYAAYFVDVGAIAAEDVDRFANVLLGQKILEEEDRELDASFADLYRIYLNMDTDSSIKYELLEILVERSSECNDEAIIIKLRQKCRWYIRNEPLVERQWKDASALLWQRLRELARAASAEE
jgi:hypothetical protein